MQLCQDSDDEKDEAYEKQRSLEMQQHEERFGKWIEVHGADLDEANKNHARWPGIHDGLYILKRIRQPIKKKV
jgi:hypothetical protein